VKYLPRVLPYLLPYRRLAVASVAVTMLLFALPFLGFSVGALLFQACRSAAHASFTSVPQRPPQLRLLRLKPRVMTAFLHLLQPLARLRGRIDNGLTLWRKRGPTGMVLPHPRTATAWSEHWREPNHRLQAVEMALHSYRAIARRGSVKIEKR
jgi:hypothetical protein